MAIRKERAYVLKYTMKPSNHAQCYILRDVHFPGRQAYQNTGSNLSWYTEYGLVYQNVFSCHTWSQCFAKWGNCKLFSLKPILPKYNSQTWTALRTYCHSIKPRTGARKFSTLLIYRPTCSYDTPTKTRAPDKQGAPRISSAVANASIIGPAWHALEPTPNHLSLSISIGSRKWFSGPQWKEGSESAGSARLWGWLCWWGDWPHPQYRPYGSAPPPLSPEPVQWA